MINDTILEKNNKIYENSLGALMQLVAIGEANLSIKNIDKVNFASTFINVELQNKYFADITIHARPDQMELKYLVFKNNKLNINEFKNIMKNSKLIIVVSEFPICIYDFELMIELNPIKIINECFIVTIPSEMTLNKINNNRRNRL